MIRAILIWALLPSIAYAEYPSVKSGHSIYIVACSEPVFDHVLNAVASKIEATPNDVKRQFMLGKYSFGVLFADNAPARTNKSELAETADGVLNGAWSSYKNRQIVAWALRGKQVTTDSQNFDKRLSQFVETENRFSRTPTIFLITDGTHSSKTVEEIEKTEFPAIIVNAAVGQRVSPGRLQNVKDGPAIECADPAIGTYGRETKNEASPISSCKRWRRRLWTGLGLASTNVGIFVE